MALRTGLLSVILAMALAVSACSSDGYVDGPVFASPRPPLLGGGGDDAIVDGTLDFDGECLYLVSGDVAYPVVWPHGASWQADPPSVVVGGHVVEPGMYVSGSGGYSSLVREAIERAVGPEVAEAALTCPGPTGEIAYFNEGSRVDVDSD